MMTTGARTGPHLPACWHLAGGAAATASSLAPAQEAASRLILMGAGAVPASTAGKRQRLGRAAWASSGRPGSPTLTAGVAGSLAPTVRSLMALGRMYVSISGPAQGTKRPGWAHATPDLLHFPPRLARPSLCGLSHKCVQALLRFRLGRHTCFRMWAAMLHGRGYRDSARSAVFKPWNMYTILRLNIHACSQSVIPTLIGTRQK